MHITKDEKEVLAKYRAQKKLEEESNEIKLIGYSKEDIYSINTNMLKEIEDGMFGWYPTKSEVKNLVEQIFTMEIPAGSEFVCYIEDGEESWYDSIYGGIVGMNAEYARKYLKDIKKVK